MDATLCGIGPDKTSLFQTLGKKTQSVPIPPQHLDPVAATPPKHKYMTAKRIAIQPVLHDGGQPVKAPAHTQNHATVANCFTYAIHNGTPFLPLNEYLIIES